MCSEWVTISGHVKDCQVPIKEKIERVINAGLDRGMTMLQKVFQRLAPSISAASSSPLGSPVINWRIIKVPKAVNMARDDERLERGRASPRLLRIT